MTKRRVPWGVWINNITLTGADLIKYHGFLRKNEHETGTSLSNNEIRFIIICANRLNFYENLSIISVEPRELQRYLLKLKTSAGKFLALLDDIDSAMDTDFKIDDPVANEERLKSFHLSNPQLEGATSREIINQRYLSLYEEKLGESYNPHHQDINVRPGNAADFPLFGIQISVKFLIDVIDDLLRDFGNDNGAPSRKHVSEFLHELHEFYIEKTGKEKIDDTFYQFAEHLLKKVNANIKKRWERDASFSNVGNASYRDAIRARLAEHRKRKTK